MVVYVLSNFSVNKPEYLKKYIDLCQHANKYKQAVLETLS